MMVRRLSSVWQVAGAASAVLVCYLVSQTVAAQRASLVDVERQITRTHDDIAALNTEIGTRTNTRQVERWNVSVLALHAPRPSQYVADGVQLVSLYAAHGRPALPLDPAITTQAATTTVAYQAPVTRAPIAPAAEPAPQPMLHVATYVRPKPDRLAGDTPGVERVAYRAPVSLLPDDVAQLADKESAESVQAKGSRAKADR